MDVENVTEKILISWSGGINSALAVHRLREQGKYEIAHLVTMAILEENRCSIHRVPLELLERQAASLNLPLEKIGLSPSARLASYKETMVSVLSARRNAGIKGVAYGDLFCDHVYLDRQDYLRSAGLKGLFPLGPMTQREVAKEFSALGFRAVIVAVDPRVLPESVLGQAFDLDFYDRLPAHVRDFRTSSDFHAFVFDGPGFQSPIRFELGDVYLRDTVMFCEMVADSEQD